MVGGLGILTLASRVLVLTALPASVRSFLPGWASPAEPQASTTDPTRASCSSWNVYPKFLISPDSSFHHSPTAAAALRRNSEPSLI